MADYLEKAGETEWITVMRMGEVLAQARKAGEYMGMASILFCFNRSYILWIFYPVV